MLEVEITAGLRWRFDGAAPIALADAAERLCDVDVVFPALHGPLGEDGTMQGFFEVLGVPYVGSGVTASALSMHKGLARRIAASLGLDVAPAVEWRGDQGAPSSQLVEAIEALGSPVFIKPMQSGSSVGVTRYDGDGDLVRAIERARAEGGDVIVEAGVAGVEVSCPVLEDGDGSPRALPVIEIVPKDHAFFDYEAKYTAGESDEICPSRLDSAVERGLRDAAVEIHRTFGCRSLSRTDFILREGTEPVFLETNTLPGLTPTSLFPKSAAVEGISYDELCERLVRRVTAPSVHP